MAILAKGRKRIVLTAALLIALTAVFFVLIPAVEASSRTGIALIDALVEGLEMFTQSIGLGVDTMEDAFMGTAGSEKAIFIDNVVDGSGVISNLLVITKTIAAGLFFVYLLVAVLSEAAQGEIADIFLFKILARAVIVLLLIIYGDAVINYVGRAMVKLVGGSVWAIERSPNALTGILTQYTDQFKNMSIPQKLNMTISISMMYIPMLVITAIAKFYASVVDRFVIIGITFVSYGILLELAIRRVLLPIAFVGLMTESANPPAIRYLKKYAAVYLRIIVYMIAVAVGENIAIHSLADSLTLDGATGTLPALGIFEGFGAIASLLEVAFIFPLQYICVMIAALGVGKKGATMLDEIMGTQ